MPSILTGPIPGESLTTEPGNVPWEQPPMYADPMDALEYHMERLADPEVTDNVIDMMDLGVPISILADTLLSSAIMDGIHSVDIKFLLKPVMAMQLKALAEVANIEYKETMQDYDDKDEIARIKNQRRIAAKLTVASKLNKKSMDKGDMLQQDVAEMMQSQEGSQEEQAPEAMPQEEMTNEMPQQGLMAKEQM